MSWFTTISLIRRVLRKALENVPNSVLTEHWFNNELQWHTFNTADIIYMTNEVFEKSIAFLNVSTDWTKEFLNPRIPLIK